MREEIKRYLLARIRSEWESLPADSRPWGVWLRHYAPLAADTINLGINTGPPLQAWFLDKVGLSERSVWEFQRFLVTHWVQPWCGRIWKERSLPVSTGAHEIGLAAFARYEDSSDVYLDWIWGGLWGRGWRIRLSANGEPVDYEGLWIS